MEYKMHNHFALAAEVEFEHYSQPGYLTSVPDKNVQNIWDNNFSFLVKYYFPLPSRMKLSLASGWTFYVHQNAHYIYSRYEISGSIIEDYLYNVSSYSNISVPFLGELSYPLSGHLDACFRVRYNVNMIDKSTYASAVGLSIKL